MELSELEELLAVQHGIPPNQRKALHARLRVLRDQGIPAVPKVGRGKRVEYSFEHLWESHAALGLTYHHTPAMIGAIVGVLRAFRALDETLRAMRASEPDRWFMYQEIAFSPVVTDNKDIEPSKSYLKIDYNSKGVCFTLKEIMNDLEKRAAFNKTSSPVGLLNLSNITRDCLAMMEKTHDEGSQQTQSLA